MSEEQSPELIKTGNPGGLNTAGWKIFPFAAIVGQEGMKAALLANAVDPSIGGVLIRGEKGTGKTTVVRALADVLPRIEAVKGCPYHCDPRNPEVLHGECRQKIAAGSAEAGEIPIPLVELPLNATEERVAGTIHLEETLKTGERHFEPGLLAAANRGILYIDEVNLLEDHLVDLILDAAATGIHRVEREGFSLLHEASFILIGTMNPEEGELRPQFIDRFGLCASIKSVRNGDDRKEITRRRLDFEGDPPAFLALWEDAQSDLRRQIIDARSRLKEVRMSDELWNRVADLSTRAEVQGHRADLVMVKTACAFAALNERSEVLAEDVREAARLALPHRIAGTADDTPESSSEQLDKLIGGNNTGAVEDLSSERGIDSGADEAEIMQVPGSAAAGSIVFDFLKKKT